MSKFALPFAFVAISCALVVAWSVQLFASPPLGRDVR
jgi:hypothetical protein